MAEVRQGMMRALQCGGKAIVIMAVVWLSAPAAAAGRPGADWQYSVRLRPAKYRRAYLWIPPECRRVRGVILAMQNMLERPFMLDPTIRRTCAQEQLAEIWISPGESTGRPQPPDMLFKHAADIYQARYRLGIFRNPLCAHAGCCAFGRRPVRMGYGHSLPEAGFRSDHV
jgi:hypothetical protein